MGDCQCAICLISAFVGSIHIWTDALLSLMFIAFFFYNKVYVDFR